MPPIAAVGRLVKGGQAAQGGKPYVAVVAGVGYGGEAAPSPSLCHVAQPRSGVEPARSALAHFGPLDYPVLRAVGPFKTGIVA